MPSAPALGMLCTALFLALGQKTLQSSNQAKKTAGEGMYHFTNSAVPSCPPALPVAGSREPTRGPRTSLHLSSSGGGRRCVAVRRALGNRCAPRGLPQQGVCFHPSLPGAARGAAGAVRRPWEAAAAQPSAALAPRGPSRFKPRYTIVGCGWCTSGLLQAGRLYCLGSRGYFCIFFNPPLLAPPTNCSAFRIILKLTALLKD